MALGKGRQLAKGFALDIPLLILDDWGLEPLDAGIREMPRYRAVLTAGRSRRPDCVAGLRELELADVISTVLVGRQVSGPTMLGD